MVRFSANHSADEITKKKMESGGGMSINGFCRQTDR